ncbi:MAG: hypothetical protein ACOCSE_05650 [Chitinivibrionales bacterium]
MKKLLTIVALLIFLNWNWIFAADKVSGVSIGVDVMLGARYDDVRMCVASDAGTKGGPIADIMFSTRLHFENGWSAGLKLPVMRPILFATAFDMLQFEPEFIFEYKYNINKDINLLIGPGIGISLHNGPDYKTKRDAQDPESFSAAGPFISGFCGINYSNESNREKAFGVRAFYIPFFSEDRYTGSVIGGALEGHFDILHKDN